MHRKAPSPRGTSISLGSSADLLSRSASRHSGIHAVKQIRHRTRSLDGRPTAGITTTTTIRSSKPTHISALEPRVRRNSLRIAIRESLATIETSPGHFGLPAIYPKPMPAEPRMRDPEPVKKLKAETQNGIGDEGNNRRHTSLVLHQRRKALLPAMPQRSSLRRAMHESLCTTTQTSSYTDTTLDDTASTHGTTSNSIIKISLPTLDDQNSNILSMSSSTVTNSNISPGIDSNVRPPSGVARTSIVSSTTIYPSTFMAEAPKLRINPRPRKKPTPESTLLTRPPTFPSLLSISKSASPASVARHQLPTEAIPPRNIPRSRTHQSGKDNSQSISSARKGWYQVQNIINETPSGLYLVEWQGRDPRTGAKWPASWVEAKNISPSAIHEWEKRDDRRILTSRDKL
ncbi:hypothetical protein F5X97DRAFT_290558, partial [Nemania serpens]